MSVAVYMLQESHMWVEVQELESTRVFKYSLLMSRHPHTEVHYQVGNTGF